MNAIESMTLTTTLLDGQNLAATTARALDALLADAFAAWAEAFGQDEPAVDAIETSPATMDDLV